MAFRLLRFLLRFWYRLLQYDVVRKSILKDVLTFSPIEDVDPPACINITNIQETSNFGVLLFASFFSRLMELSWVLDWDDVFVEATHGRCGKHK